MPLIWRSLFTGALTGVLLLVCSASGQTPSSIAGDGFLVRILDGVYPFASQGYYLFLPANAVNTYQIIGIYSVLSWSGTYSYSVTGPSAAVIDLNGSPAGFLRGSASFANSTFGNLYVTASSYPGSYQLTDFDYASVAAPSSIAGKQFGCTVYDGLYPFANSGTFTLKIAASGNTFTVVGDGMAVASSSGTYSYSLVNRSTGKLQINDSLAGGSTVYVGLSDQFDGGYAVTQPSSGGFQIGSFVIVDTMPPTISITNPPSARSYTTSQSVAISVSASDDVGVSNVEFYEGPTLKGNSAIPPYTYIWSFGAVDNGSQVWSARAYDAAGNVKTSAPVTLTVAIDLLPPTVRISTPRWPGR